MPCDRPCFSLLSNYYFSSLFHSLFSFPNPAGPIRDGNVKEPSQRQRRSFIRGRRQKEIQRHSRWKTERGKQLRLVKMLNSEYKLRYSINT